MHRITSQAGVEDTLRGPDLASIPGSLGGRRYRPSGSPRPPGPPGPGLETRGRV